MCFPDRRRHLRVSVPITFRDQAEYECCDDEQRYSPLNGSEAKSLPHFIEFETPDLFNQGTIYRNACGRKRLPNYTVVLLGAVFGKRASFVSQRFNRVEAVKIAKISL